MDKLFFLLLLFFTIGFTGNARAEFDYGRTCPTVEAALIRLAQERENAAAEALKTGQVSPLNFHNTPVPGNFQGYWSLPNCDTPDVTQVFTKYFSYSIIYGTEACLQKIRYIREGSNFTEFSVPSNYLVNRKLDDNSYITGFTLNNEPADLSKDWEGNRHPETQTFTFHYCPAPSPDHYKLHAPGLKFVRYLDHVLEICDQSQDLAFKNNEECHHLLYVMADDNVDFELTKEEIIKALKMLHYASYINHNGAMIENLRLSLDKAEKKAILFADLAVSLLDEDNNRTLKRTEITKNYKRLPEDSPEWFFFQRNFRSLGNIFPSFDNK